MNRYWMIKLEGHDDLSRNTLISLIRHFTVRGLKKRLSVQRPFGAFFSVFKMRDINAFGFDRCVLSLTMKGYATC